jgi:hypothetical protein
MIAALMAPAAQHEDVMPSGRVVRTKDQGGSAMKKHVGSYVLAMLAILGLSVAVAHAGRGQGGSSVSVFDCYTINGKNANRVVGLMDQFGAQEDVSLGFGKLVCTFATMTKRATDPPEAEPDFDATPGELSQDHLKCYEVGPPNQNTLNAAVDARLFDPIAGGQNTETDGELVTVAKTRYVCTFAVKILQEP